MQENIINKKIVGFIAGSFDLLHPGHIHVLAESQANCEWLIVGLHVDRSIEKKGKNKPVQTVLERFIQLKACKYVDEIVPYETEEDLINILKTFSIDIRFLGTEYERVKNTGQDIIPIKFIKRDHSYSSSELRKRL